MIPNKTDQVSDWKLHCTACLSALLYLVLVGLSRRPELFSVHQFLSLMAALFALCSLGFHLARKDELRNPTLIVLGWAIVFRVIAWLGHPIFEDDYFRYLWDGYRFATDGTPYGVTPASYFADSTIPLKFQLVLDNINYPSVPTIYGPILQYSFLLGWFIAPGEILVLQILYSVIDIALILFLLRFALPHWVLLYAWCPLIVKETAFTAHPDIVGVALLCFGLRALITLRLGLASLLLALSVAAKIFALIFIPFLCLQLLRQKKLHHLLTFLATLLVLYAPFLWMGAGECGGLIVFVNEWSFNSTLFVLLGSFFSNGTTKLLCAGVFVACYSLYCLYYYRNTGNNTKEAGGKFDSMPRGDLLFGLFFLCAPVVNAWYLLWLLPFGVIFQKSWVWWSAFALCISYATGLNLGLDNLQAFAIPTPLTILEYGIVVVAVMWEVKKNRSPSTSQYHFSQNLR